ncbi:MAG: hypothetical protein GF350_09150 [Chitinivibrionales bacterium]|nr:hypothetical protein [Chitinivibrionales bacterium]
MKYHKKRACILLFYIAHLSGAVSAAPMATYYISPTGNDSNPGVSQAQPFQTLEKARDAVRAINGSMTGDIEVVLLPGTYIRDSTFRLDERDGGSGGYRVIYKASQQYAASISGGVRISGWTVHDSSANIYTASWDRPGLDSPGFRQMYVDGKRCIRAREPNLHPRDENDYYLGNRETDYHELLSWVSMQNGFVVDTAEVNHWLPLIPSDDYLRLVEAGIMVEWEKFFLRLEGFTFTAGEATFYPQAREQIVLMKNPYPPKIPGQRYHFENALAFVDAEGEFFVDPFTRKVFYKPRAVEGDLSASTIIVPAVDTLVKIEPRGEDQSGPDDDSRLDTPVKNIVFKNLIFEYTTWMRPSIAGHIPVQAEDYSVLLDDGSRRYHRALGNVYLKACDSIRFERNVFQHMGATALDLHFGCHDNVIIGNVFYDISANGIAEGDLHDSTVHPVADPENAKRLNARNSITDNYVYNTGQCYTGAVGIQSGFADGSYIAHNEVHGLPYSGICFGWHGGYSGTAAQNNIIRGNLVHDVMRLMHDGGAIYVLGTQPGSVIDSNCIYTIYKYAPEFNSFFPLYLDNGANGLTVRDNRVTDVNSPMIIRFNTSGPNETGANGDSVPETVCFNAGIRPEYRDIKVFLGHDTTGYSPAGRHIQVPVKNMVPVNIRLTAPSIIIETSIHYPHTISVVRSDGSVVSRSRFRSPAAVSLTRKKLSANMYFVRVKSRSIMVSRPLVLVR